MVILGQVGYMMKETGTIKMKNNSVILLKTILVISVSSMTFFIVGFGLAMDSKGGLLGDDYFFGLRYKIEDYTYFIYYFALCVKMAVIATGSIGERVEIDRYIFFCFINSGFIRPTWVWQRHSPITGWIDH